MTRLVVLDQQNNQEFELDMYGTENVNVTLQVDDVRNIESKQASYSKSFNIPATKNNNKFFESYYNVDSYFNTFSVYKNVKAFLFVGEILILEGFMRLENALESNTEISYSIVLFNDVANIIETLGDDTIANLDFSDIEHTFNTTNIVASWSGNTILDAGGTTDNVFYPLINDGNIYTDQDNLFVSHRRNFIMNLKLKYVLDKIFEHAGFSYTSTFFDSSLFNDIYFDIGMRVEGVTSDFTNANIIADTGEGSDSIDGNASTNVGNSMDNAVALNFLNETGDQDDLFDHNTCTFTAPYNCYVNFEFIFRAETEETSILYLTDGNSNLASFGWLQQNTSDLVTMTGSKFVTQGSTLQFKFYAFTDTMHIFNTLTSLTDADSRPTLKLNIIDVSTTGLIHAKRGDLGLADIVKDVVKAFNLTIESSGNSELKIEPYSDYITNTVIDWTKKINTNDFTVEPIDIPKRIILQHAEDSDDYYLNQYIQNHGDVYGKQVLEFDVDSSEVIDISLEVFAAPFIKQLEGTTAVIQHIARKEGSNLESYDNKPRLVYKNANGFNITPFVEDVDDAAIFAAFQTINSATHYEGSNDANDPIPQVTASSTSLLFGYTNLIYTPTLPAQPLNTLFLKYWYNYLNERYNTTNGLLYKAEFYLTPSDILNFSFADKVRVQDQLYRVNRIEYNTDINSLAKVELLRI